MIGLGEDSDAMVGTRHRAGGFGATSKGDGCVRSVLSMGRVASAQSGRKGSSCWLLNFEYQLAVGRIIKVSYTRWIFE